LAVTPTRAPAKTGRVERPHRIVVPVLIVVGALCILVSTVSVWIRDVALDPEVWADTSTELLESPDVRDALSVSIRRTRPPRWRPASRKRSLSG
jgi:ABC-type Fe3+ transport system permease subunit